MCLLLNIQFTIILNGCNSYSGPSVFDLKQDILCYEHCPTHGRHLAFLIHKACSIPLPHCNNTKAPFILNASFIPNIVTEHLGKQSTQMN